MLFVGPTGTGKSAYVQEKLMHGIDRVRYISTFVNFSAQTSANMTQVSAQSPRPVDRIPRTALLFELSPVVEDLFLHIVIFSNVLLKIAKYNHKLFNILLCNVILFV